MSQFQNGSSRRLPGRSLGAKTGEEAPYFLKFEPRLASQARHRFVAHQETFASRIVVLGCYGVLKEPLMQEFYALDGAILIDKPAGPTSHDVVDVNEIAA